MDLKECMRKGLVKRVMKDVERAKSLTEMAKIKEEAVQTASINAINISAYVSLAYDALRELLEALCMMHGYKVLSHICMGELLRDILDDFDYEEFDRFRWVRNSINYYGEQVEFGQGKDLIKKMFSMKKKIVEKYLKGF